jgi:hypothetical protein
MGEKDSAITRRDRFCALTYNILRTVEGKEWLNILKEDYLVKSPVAFPGKDASFAFHREGQNSMIRLIEESGTEVKK